MIFYRVDYFGMEDHETSTEWVKTHAEASLLQWQAGGSASITKVHIPHKKNAMLEWLNDHVYRP